VRLLAANRALTRTYLRFAVMMLCIYTVFYGITQWMEASRGLSSLTAGLVLLPMSVLSGLIARPISQRNLLRTPLILAAVCCLAGSAGTLLLAGDTPVGWIVAVTLVFGVTTGAGFSANQTALYAQVPGADIGTASGLLRSFGYIGSIASSAIIAMVFRTHVSDHGLHVIAIIMIAVSAVALLLTLADRQLMSPASTRRHPAARPRPDPAAEPARERKN
jgi:sugar phosphate permease